MQQIERAVPSRQSAWDTAGVRPAEQFAYYREAICQAFMNLTPEPAAAAGFPASVEHVRLGDAAINRVSFPEHVVRRSGADIAASDRSCFYLNLKLAGRCRILQGNREISLSPGQVGIFDSDQQFALLHDRGPQLRVASFWVPAEALRERLPASFDVAAVRVSDDPFVGHLIVETARTLSDGALRMTEDEGALLFRALIELVAVSLSRRSRAGAAESENLADTTTLALKRAIHRRLREPGLAVAMSPMPWASASATCTSCWRDRAPASPNTSSTIGSTARPGISGMLRWRIVRSAPSRSTGASRTCRTSHGASSNASAAGRVTGVRNESSYNDLAISSFMISLVPP